jgi:hypothetical protein
MHLKDANNPNQKSRVHGKWMKMDEIWSLIFPLRVLLFGVALPFNARHRRSRLVGLRQTPMDDVFQCCWHTLLGSTASVVKNHETIIKPSETIVFWDSKNLRQPQNCRFFLSGDN